jgi:epoxide hydrolase 4
MSGFAWEHREVKLSQVRLHCVVQGDGPLLILLHGFPVCWYSWAPMIAELATEYTVVAPDLRGYNLSQRPSGVKAYDSALVAGDIAELIVALGHSTAKVVGHDWGGAIAFRLAADHPDRVEKLSVLNCPHPAVFVKHLMSNFRQIRRSWYIFFFQLPWLPEWFIGRDIEGFLRLACRPRRAFTDEAMAYYKQALQKPGAVTATINYYRAAARAVFGRGQRWAKISCPFLLIWGVRDSALGVELTEGMERFFEGSIQKEYFPDAGHWVHDQEPERVLELLREFLGS